ncbi:scavenger mRNA decapping enzyme [Neolentinus lepideus HHB14362 ss-1]|uniref:Scavenger mRNA decapping enzyme n=1 Tax=Neolentinus lepideus HHB14362 ss-1 TaxID=1314782 RepID=A0A165QR70_9AGAM|nr:scavenger mRNA decapping enzyme [Neolentinus lepideus HHB14362 ss-1]
MEREVDLQSLKAFVLERVLDEDPVNRTIILLGSFGDSTHAIVRIEKTALSSSMVNALGENLEKVEHVEKNDIYSWFMGWLSTAARTSPDLKINVIFPCTEAHIQKYTRQQIVMVHETPALYKSIVEPYISAFPPSRTQWVTDILAGKTEADKILYRDTDSATGYVILPDMKWDLTTLSSLYLVAIALSPYIRSLRDLRRMHIPMLKSVRREAMRVVRERWGLGTGAVRFFVHYQPSYYHFHVHIVNANYAGLMGSTVGQAHLLDDIISMLECDVNEGPTIFERLTLTYGLGDQHGLYAPLVAAQADVEP